MVIPLTSEIERYRRILHLSAPRGMRAAERGLDSILTSQMLLHVAPPRRRESPKSTAGSPACITEKPATGHPLTRYQTGITALPFGLSTLRDLPAHRRCWHLVEKAKPRIHHSACPCGNCQLTRRLDPVKVLHVTNQIRTPHTPSRRLSWRPLPANHPAKIPDFIPSQKSQLRLPSFFSAIFIIQRAKYPLTPQPPK